MPLGGKIDKNTNFFTHPRSCFRKYYPEPLMGNKTFLQLFVWSSDAEITSKSLKMLYEPCFWVGQFYFMCLWGHCRYKLSFRNWHSPFILTLFRKKGFTWFRREILRSVSLKKKLLWPLFDENFIIHIFFWLIFTVKTLMMRKN